jgi:dTDP-4-amino-4,6-dideoxygalactose transaminase
MKISESGSTENPESGLEDDLPTWPCFDSEDIDAVRHVLASGRVNYWTGVEGRRFEEEFAAWLGRKHAVALANGTVALELALYALGIGPGDEVITSCRTFIASASAIVMRGAIPILADVDIESQNITAETVEPLISPRTRAIIVVHLAGWPCDMDPLLSLARSRGIRIIEDCAQAHGARYKGKLVGSLGDIAAFSFCQDKIMTTGGEGGMLCTDQNELWQRAWSFKEHGRTMSKCWPPQKGLSFRYIHDSFGTNWRLTEIQAALGRQALLKLDSWIARRRANAETFSQSLANCAALRLTIPSDDYYHSYYKYYAFLRPENLRPEWNRDRILFELQQKGIPCLSGSCPELYREQAFVAAGLVSSGAMPTARYLGETSLMFQVHPTLEGRHIYRVSQLVRQILDFATK